MRLFIVCSKTATEDELRDEFSQWGGTVENVTLLRDKQSGNLKGFGYIRFARFYDAAVAIENCAAKYKAVFAEPKDSSRLLRDTGRDDNSMMGGGRGGGGGNMGGNNYGGGGNVGFGGGYNNGGNNWSHLSNNKEMAQFLRLQNVQVPTPTCLEVIASNCVNQDQLWRLFDIIPCLTSCKIIRECKYIQQL